MTNRKKIFRKYDFKKFGQATINGWEIYLHSYIQETRNDYLYVPNLRISLPFHIFITTG